MDLGASLVASGYKIHLLYMCSGDADNVAYQAGFVKAVNGLSEASLDHIYHYYKEVFKNGIHNFNVWNNGAYNFSYFIF